MAEYVAMVNELLDEIECELWMKGVQIGADGELQQVDTAWAMGVEDEG